MRPVTRSPSYTSSSVMPLIRIPAHISVALMLALGPLTACRRSPPDGVALVGATLFDGSGGPVLPNAVVVVRRGRIESVGTRAGFTLPAKTREVDVTGRWIIPGLIDAHAHVEPWALPRYLAWGVTTVRDVHGALDSVLRLRDRVNLGAVAGPRIYSAGAMIDGLPTTYPDAIGANSPRDARKAVDRLVNAGVDLIKVYTRVDPTLLRAVIDEAGTFNLRVAGHLGLTDAVTAAKEGIGSIEHLSGVPEASMADASSLYAAHYRGFFPGWTAFERSWGGLDSAALARVAKELADRKVTLVPTLVLHETFSRLDDPAVLGDTMLKAVPELAQARWNVADMVRPRRMDRPGLSRIPGGPPEAGPLPAPLRRRGRAGRHRHRRVEPDAHPRLQRAPRARVAGGGGVLAAGCPAGGDQERGTAPRRGLARHPGSREGGRPRHPHP